MGLQGEIPLQGDFSAEHMIFGGESLLVPLEFFYTRSANIHCQLNHNLTIMGAMLNQLRSLQDIDSFHVLVKGMLRIHVQHVKSLRYFPFLKY
jgi:hypothetical protein